MLTRLKVNGFKNLVDVDVRFGPFTCIAGVNGSGKSNLFDAIRFLAALAEKPLVEAALSIRGGGRSSDIRDLFHRVGDKYAEEMSFEAEMIVPAEGLDEIGRSIRASNTLLRYTLRLAYVDDNPGYPNLPLRIVQEHLTTIDKEAPEALLFPHTSDWIETAVIGSQGESRELFGTAEEAGGRLRWTYEGQGPEVTGADNFIAAPVFRTFLSAPGESRSQTAVLAHQEMRSWRVLQLDPAAMRKPDEVTAPARIGDDGSHVAATLYNVAHAPWPDGSDPTALKAAVYARVRNRLFRLLGEMKEIRVERDEKRGELTLYATGRDGTTLPARALSDGTLRFLALAILEQQEQGGLYCIEEPENGVHPGRVESLLKLLQAIAMDTSFPIEEGNPLRQVIISTHSPSVVMRVPEDSLLMAELWPSHDNRGRFTRARFRGLARTWRDPAPDRNSLALGTLLDYLNPEGYRPLPEPDLERRPDSETRIMDREDLHRLFSPVPRADG